MNTLLRNLDDDDAPAASMQWLHLHNALHVDRNA